MKIKKTIRSFKYAIQGLSKLWNTQNNFQVHAVALLLVLIACWWFDCSVLEWCLVIFSIGLVLVSEAFNTSIEFLTDYVHPEWGEKAGAIKDVAAAAVLIAAITAIAIAGLIFIPKVL